MAIREYLIHLTVYNYYNNHTGESQARLHITITQGIKNADYQAPSLNNQTKYLGVGPLAVIGISLNVKKFRLPCHHLNFIDF